MTGCIGNQMSLDAVNRVEWEREETAEAYGQSELMPAEAALLDRYHDRIAGKRVLDLGCGAGRTTAALSILAAEYTGIDYSQAMVDASRRRFPGLRFERVDVRDMTCFEDRSFDFILFSYNGLDYIDHEKRLQALGEIRRLLASGGLFVFSSHNRRYRRAGAGPTLECSGNPVVLVRRIIRYVRQRRRRARLGGCERCEQDYAILNDSGRGYALLTYYIDPVVQIRQLESAGFACEGLFDSAGNPVTADADTSDHVAIHYAASASAADSA